MPVLQPEYAQQPGNDEVTALLMDLLSGGGPQTDVGAMFPGAPGMAEIPGVSGEEFSQGMMPMSPGDLGGFARLLQSLKGMFGGGARAYMGPAKGAFGGGAAPVTPREVPMTPGVTRGAPLPPRTASSLDDILAMHGGEGAGMNVGNLPPGAGGAPVNPLAAVDDLPALEEIVSGMTPEQIEDILAILASRG